MSRPPAESEGYRFIGRLLSQPLMTRASPSQEPRLNHHRSLKSHLCGAVNPGRHFFVLATAQAARISAGAIPILPPSSAGGFDCIISKTIIFIVFIMLVVLFGVSSPHVRRRWMAAGWEWRRRRLKLFLRKRCHSP